MDHFQQILKMLQTQQQISKSTDMARAILGRDFTNGFNKLKSAESVARTITSKLYNPFIGNDTFNMMLRTSFGAAGIAIPNPAINRIIKSQFSLDQIFSKMPLFPDLGFLNISYPSLKQVYRSITDKASKMAEVTKNEEELEAIAEVTEQTTAFAATIDEKSILTKDDLAIYQDKLLAFLINHVLPKKWLKISHANWTQFIMFIIGVLISYIMWRYPHENGQQSSPQEIQQVQKDTMQRIDQFIAKDTISRKLNKNFNLRADPLFSSKRLYYLKKDSIVLVLNSTNTWVLITFISHDGYPVSGWVPKTLLASK